MDVDHIQPPIKAKILSKTASAALNRVN